LLVIVLTAATAVVNPMPATRMAKPAKNIEPNLAGDVTMLREVKVRASCENE
jgi:hypothetical protein